MPLTLISPAFAEGQRIPDKYARRGENIMPPLKWSGVPEGTRSFVLIIEDPDAPNGTFHHLGMFNIPAGWLSLQESADTVPGGGPRFVTNDFGFARYDGPQPPAGHGVHRYFFRLAALDVPSLSSISSAKVGELWREAKKHTLAEASVMGTYETTG